VVRRLVIFALVLSVATVSLARASGEGTTEPGTTEPPVTTEPPATTEPPVTEPPVTEPPVTEPPVPLLIPDGVTIAGIPVGGMTGEQASFLVQSAFDEPLRLRHGSHRWTVRPDLIGATARVDTAIEEAFATLPGSSVELEVAIKAGELRDYAKSLSTAFSRPAKNARLRLVKLKPRISEAKLGFDVSEWKMVSALSRALREGQRAPIALEGKTIKPEVTSRSFSRVIVIRRESKRLYLYRGEDFWRKFGVATGQPSYPTPTGRFSIAVMWKNPWWYPPPSPWAEDEEPVPPGPGNPLGTRWMGLTAPYVGIHGTPDSASIGYSASHGCIRMLISDAEWLFDHVGVGTTVFIVPR
jgi:lipoprotein-anchoring transpeptidase ErfK/SrfK